MRIIVQLLIIINLAGCATLGPKRMPTNEYGKSITIIGSLDNQMRLMLIGTTVFNNSINNIDAADLHLEEEITKTVSEKMKSKGNFRVTISKDKSIREQVRNINPYVSTTFWKIGDQKKMIQGLAKRLNADLLVVINNATYNDKIFGTDVSIEGYGIYERSFLGIKRAVNYCSLRIIVYDGATGNELAFASDLSHEPRNNEEWSSDLNYGVESINKTKASIKKLYISLANKLLAEMGLN